MDEGAFKDRLERLKELNKTIEKLDPAIRAEAFNLLKGYVTGSAAAGTEHTDPDTSGDSGGDLLTRFSHDKPADNAKLLAAEHFSAYGSAPFSIDEIRSRAAEAGITIPNRPGDTYRAATNDGKKLFMRTGHGTVKPTVHGEKFLKDTYQVKKGTKKKPNGDD